MNKRKVQVNRGQKKNRILIIKSGGGDGSG